MIYSFDAEYFEPKATLECGQVFRFQRLAEQDYFVTATSKRARIYKKGGTTYLDCDDKDYFFNYFDLATDYAAIIERLSAFDELKGKLEKGKGIRILRQDFDETVVSFIISANNNIPRIKGIIERLADNFGTDMGDYRAFPTLEQLKEVDIPTFRALGTGFRDRYIHGTVHALINSNIREEIFMADTKRACKLLCSLPGIGPKVADCIALFGMARTDCYPVDTWIFKANCSKELDTPAKVRDHYLNRYGADSGYAQQYIFYSQIAK